MYNDIRENKNKGFSLVELIVVIAIMAVMVAVLAPSLLQYVERSRAQKDDSAMGELTNAVMLALSDQNVYDEVLYYTTHGNVSCYIDAATEAALEQAGKDSKTVTKVDAAKKDQYLYGDDARMKDETPFTAAGNMRGVTVTFHPEKSSNKSTFVLGNGVINEFVKPTGGTAAASDRVKSDIGYINATPTYDSTGTLATMASGTSKNTYLYNRVRATIADKIQLTSQTYRNSDYTVFIRMGSTGGNQASAQDAIAVYGQWNGTNLIAGQDPLP